MAEEQRTPPSLSVPLLEFVKDSIAAKYDLAMAEIRRLAALLDAQEKMSVEIARASKEAITKAENAQSAYNRTHNDLLAKMDTMSREQVSRESLTSEIRRLEGQNLSHEQIDNAAHERMMADIRELRESRSKVEGSGEGRVSSRSDQTRTLTLLISVGFLIVAVLQIVLHFFPVVAK